VVPHSKNDLLPFFATIPGFGVFAKEGSSKQQRVVPSTTLGLCVGNDLIFWFHPAAQLPDNNDRPKTSPTLVALIRTAAATKKKPGS